MNVTTDVQQTTEETKAKRYKTLFGSALFSWNGSWW
ncbi:hypothetical protein IKG_05343 [Bacillus cereus VD200]|nr:hypothetical protein IKG_05343 [Bacillus cereus VD200]